jgi:hypothetical protein
VKTNLEHLEKFCLVTELVDKKEKRVRCYLRRTPDLRLQGVHPGSGVVDLRVQMVALTGIEPVFQP